MKATDLQLQEASRLGLVMLHPLRIKILCLTAERSGASSSLIASELNLGISNVAHHVGVLVKTKCLQLIDVERNRGAPKNIYKVSPYGASVLELVLKPGGLTRPCARP
jgi:predicted ArsR family transcriptional regulator